MGTLNKVTLIGYLGGAPQLRYTPKSIAVATFSLATNEVWKDKDGTKKERTEWHRIIVWGKLAETISEHTAKGRQVCIIGRIRSRQYEDREKIERTAYEIHADEIVMLGKREGTEEADAPAAGAPTEPDSLFPPEGEAPASEEGMDMDKGGEAGKGKQRAAKK